MKVHVTPTSFENNLYETSWGETDYLYTPDGIGRFPSHPCKITFELSAPYIKHARNAVDIGCRDGEYTRYLHRTFSMTYAFDPRVREYFSYNCDLSKVTHYACALGDEAGKIEMYEGRHKRVSALRRLFSRKAWTAPVYTLDSFGLENVDYIKVDVEGYERKVLFGATETILRCRPLIIIEQNEACLPGESAFAAKTYLEELGYRHVATCPRGWDHIMCPE